MLILELLRYAAGPPSPIVADKVASVLQTAKPRELQWALDAGLGPLLCEVTRTAVEPVPTTLGEVLLSADLTARVLHDNRIEATEEIIDACAAIGVPVTLLKGISVSEQHYPSSHHRTMSDIDILVPVAALADAEAAARRLGYARQGPTVTGPGHHHGEPLYNSRRQIELEIHTALFGKSSPFSQGDLFSPENIERQSIASTFRGRRVRRLSDELQLVYIASYWGGQDLTGQPIHPSFLPPIFDVVQILRDRKHALDWDRVLQSLDNERASASLCLMLSYLSRRDLVQFPRNVLPRLAMRQESVGAGELWTIHALVDKFLVGGRPFYRAVRSSYVWASLMMRRPYLLKLLSLTWNIMLFRAGPRTDSALGGE